MINVMKVACQRARRETFGLRNDFSPDKSVFHNKISREKFNKHIFESERDWNDKTWARALLAADVRIMQNIISGNSLTRTGSTWKPSKGFRSLDEKQRRLRSWNSDSRFRCKFSLSAKLKIYDFSSRFCRSAWLSRNGISLRLNIFLSISHSLIEFPKNSSNSSF